MKNGKRRKEREKERGHERLRIKKMRRKNRINNSHIQI